MSVAKQVVDLQSLGIIKHGDNEETTVEKVLQSFIIVIHSLFYDVSCTCYRMTF